MKSKKMYCSDCQKEIKSDEYHWKLGKRFFHGFQCLSRFIRRHEYSAIYGVRKVRYK